jgi:hypothetical protein
LNSARSLAVLSATAADVEPDEEADDDGALGCAAEIDPLTRSGDEKSDLLKLGRTVELFDGM